MNDYNPNQMLPDHGYWDGVYDDEQNNIEGYQLHARNIVKIVTPYFEPTPPDNINFQQINDTTDKWTMTTTIDDVPYINEFTIIVTGRGTESEMVQSMTLPSGHIITFTNS